MSSARNGVDLADVTAPPNGAVANAGERFQFRSALFTSLSPAWLSFLRWNSPTAVLFAFVALLAVAGCRGYVESSSAIAPPVKPGERGTIDFFSYAILRTRRL